MPNFDPQALARLGRAARRLAAIALVVASNALGQPAPTLPAVPASDPSVVAAPVPPSGASGPGATPPAGDEGGVSLNFPDNMELKVLIDYVSQRLGLNVAYPEELVANQRITIKAPAKVPAGALLPLLESMLKARGLALSDGDQPGWKRIAPIAASALPTTQAAKAADRGPNRPVSRIFSLQNLDPQKADQLVKAMLSGPNATSVGLSEQRLEVVTDFASNIDRIAELIRLIDQPNTGTRVEFLAVKNADASQLAQQVKAILAAKVRAQSPQGQNAEPVEVTADKRTGQLIVVGPAALVEEAQRVTRSLDLPVSEQQSPIRFYKLANATAADVLDTIRALTGEGGGDARRERGSHVGDAVSPNPARSGSFSAPAGGTTGGGAAGGGAAGGPGQGITLVPYATGAGGNSPASSPLNTITTGSLTLTLPGDAGAADAGGSRSSGLTATPGLAGEGAPAAPAGLRTKDATVAADTNTNTIIVIAEPAAQKVYETLIKTLDKRRPQVMIECTIATLDTTNNYQLGVEISARSRGGGGKDGAITFSNFGLSTPDPKTGSLALIPGVGFNGAVVSSDIAQVILRALSTNSRAKVTSTPRILVNDNSSGTLSSLVEFPFSSTNIGNSVSTTSFGDYAKAGTQIVLTPHISEADYLQLEYAVALSSFQGTGDPTRGVPPPIVSDSVQSKVTIPDGSTVIVGGLNRTNFNKTVNSVPLLGEIPVLKYLFGNRNTTDQTTTLFVFLRPVILRDDQFADLKFLSERDLKSAGLPAGWPSSEPLPVR